LRLSWRGRKIRFVLFENNKNDIAELAGNSTDSCQMSVLSMILLNIIGRKAHKYKKRKLCSSTNNIIF